MPRRRIYFGEDEFPRRKQPVLRRHGLEMYTFFPPFIHRDLDEERNGFDCYIVGEIRPGEKMELLASFHRLEKGRYKKLNLYILQGCNKGECTVVLNFFMLKYARRNNYVFLNCGMRDELK